MFWELIAGICENISALEYPIDDFKRVFMFENAFSDVSYLILMFLDYFQRHKRSLSI